MSRVRIAVCLAVALLASSCGGAKQTKTLLIVVDAPFTRSAYLGQAIADGVDVAVFPYNARGGIGVGTGAYTLRVERLDNAQSPSRAVADARSAIASRAAAIITDGTGVNAYWQLADKAHIPICIVYDGGSGLVDPVQRPNVFRIAPTDHGISFRYAEYLIPKRLKVAFLTDDSGYGREGRAALEHAFAQNPEAVAAKIEIPTSTTDLAPQVLQARRAGATALLIWAEPAGVAEALIAARASGWRVHVYAAPSGEDPLIRQELAGHPHWVDGLTFAAGRMTAEVGTAPFFNFEQFYEATVGRQKVGVSSAAGRPVYQPPDYAMYPYDFVHLLVAALTAAQTTDGANVIKALNQVSVEAANGDQRGFNEKSHEGVVDDDVYFGRFSGMVYRPVKDDPLSSTLPVIPQEG